MLWRWKKIYTIWWYGFTGQSFKTANITKMWAFSSIFHSKFDFPNFQASYAPECFWASKTHLGVSKSQILLAYDQYWPHLKEKRDHSKIEKIHFWAVELLTFPVHSPYLKSGKVWFWNLKFYFFSMLKCDLGWLKNLCTSKTCAHKKN